MSVCVSSSANPDTPIIPLVSLSACVEAADKENAARQKEVYDLSFVCCLMYLLCVCVD